MHDWSADFGGLITALSLLGHVAVELIEGKLIED